MTRFYNKKNFGLSKTHFNVLLSVCVAIGLSILIYSISYIDFFVTHYDAALQSVKSEVVELPKKIGRKPLDTKLYDEKMMILANNPAPKVIATSTASTTKPVKPPLWPAKTVYPNAGALLPFNRIIAYYGNFLSKGMGVLGQYPEAEMLEKLRAEVKRWEAADPETPVVPAIHYIAVTAQGSAGKDGKYILRMPDSQIDLALEVAKKVNGIVFLDVQIGLSTLQKEIPLLDTYLKLPNVHLGIDPEFSMKTGIAPGHVIGTMDAADINYVINHLAEIVKANDLPPKVLVIHRFTQDMVTNYKLIKPLPEVQIVMHMDGWGSPAKKFGTYSHVIVPEPVQFTGFKLFYRNDLKPPSTRMITPDELLNLSPRPIYIQYQ